MKDDVAADVALAMANVRVQIELQVLRGLTQPERVEPVIAVADDPDAFIDEYVRILLNGVLAS